MAKIKHPLLLPAVVFVKWETDGDDPYLALYESVDGPENGDRVGIYELRETKTKHVTHELK